MRKVLFIILCVIFATPGYAASLINDTETERVITDLIAPLAAAADIPDGRLRVHIVGDNQFNAFVMGGEDVYVYTGLLTQIKSPDALQAVVAHELGHTIGGHMTQMSDRMSAEMLRTMIIQALGKILRIRFGTASVATSKSFGILFKSKSLTAPPTIYA